MPSASEPLPGSCLCGGVRFRILGDFSVATYCHCAHCQKRTGTAASAQGRVAADHFELLSGEDLLRTFTPRQGRPKVFCSVCGSSLFGGALRDDAIVSVRLGSLDGDPGIRPGARCYVQSAVLWEAVPDDGLPRFDGPRPA